MNFTAINTISTVNNISKESATSPIAPPTLPPIITAILPVSNGKINANNLK